MRHSSILFLLVLCFSISYSQKQDYQFPKLSGPYLGQKPPGRTPEIFAPGIISTAMTERDITISGDGKQIFYGLASNRLVTIMTTKEVNGKWTEPELASFASGQDYFFFEPCLTSNGKKIFFLTTHPPKGKEPKGRWAYQNIWTSDKREDGTWTDPYDPDTNINGDSHQYYPSLTKEGTIYFSRVEGQTSQPSIFRSRFINGKFTIPEKLPAIVNKEGTSTYNAFISPDEKFLIACVEGRNYDLNPGKVNYFIFFRDKDDNWSEGIPLGPEINMKGSNAASCSLSPDGKYFFFAAQKTIDKYSEPNKIKSLSDILYLWSNPMNGDYDIYWVDAGFIKDLKSKK